MNEVTRIHLGRQPFTISVEAHQALKVYLSAIKRQVGAKHIDVLEEVETRMAELLTERGIKGEKVVVAEDIVYLQEQLGEPQEFKEDGETPDDSEEDRPKRLFRDPENGIISGVAVGLAAYFGVDPTIARLLFVLLLFFGGGGVLLYLVLWVIMPEAKSRSDHLQMHGKAVTVGSLKGLVERAHMEDGAKRAGSVVRQMIEGVFRIALVGAGVLCVSMALLGLLAIVSGGAVMVTNPDHVFNGVKLFPVNGREMILLGLGLATGIISMVFLLFAGLGMIRRRWLLPGWAMASLASIFFVSVAAGSALTVRVAPDIEKRYERAHYSVNRPLNEFKQLVIADDSVEVVYEPATKHSIEVQSFGSRNTSGIKTRIDGEVLHLDTREFSDEDDCIWVCVSTETLKIIVRAPELREVSVGENVDFAVQRQLKQPAFTIRADPQASLNMQYMNPEQIVLIIENEGDKTFEITGLRAAQSKDMIWADPYSATTISKTDAFELKAADTCFDKPLVFLDQAPKAIKVNGKAFASVDEFLGLQAPEDPSQTQCVQIAAPAYKFKEF